MTQRMVAAVAAFGLLGLAGCGTITQGTNQLITVTSTPSGGRCELTREGEHVGTVDQTPGTVKVSKTKHDITMTCSLSGYRDATVNLQSGYGWGTFGNVILGGAVGWGIDSATGADNKYPNVADVTFVPVSAAPAAAPAPAAGGTKPSS